MAVFNALTTTVLPVGFVGVAYEASIAVNGEAVAELTLEAGTVQTDKDALPASLSYGTDGRITGTPQPGDAGTYLLSVKATDGTNSKDNAALTLVIFDSKLDRAWLEDETVDQAVTVLNMGG